MSKAAIIMVAQTAPTVIPMNSHGKGPRSHQSKAATPRPIAREVAAIAQSMMRKRDQANRA